MTNPTDTALVFGFLTLFHALGGGAIGAGLRGRRALPVVWGLLIGAAPLYFGIERVTRLHSWTGLVWQIAALAASAAAVAWRLPRLRALTLRAGMNTLIIGTFIMTAGAVLGAWLLKSGSEIGSLIAGGLSFLFGAMWFGAGIKQLRDP